MSLTDIGMLIGGLVFLVLGGEFLVRGASRLALSLGIPPIIVGLTVVAFGTSTPELAVSLEAAIGGNADIAISNVVGSNIFNILFILGICALIHPLFLHSQIVKREIPIMIGASILFLLTALDLKISRLEGGLLFLGIIVYTSWLVIEARSKSKENKKLEQESDKEFKEEKKGSLLTATFYVVGGLGVVMLGANWMVNGAIQIAKMFGVSNTVIGLTIVAAGTSLPEVIASVMATIKGEKDIAVGNVIGSNIYNIFSIIGLSGLIVPGGLNVAPSLLKFDFYTMIGTAILCLPFFGSKNSLGRVKGTLFLVGYVAYTVYLIKVS